MAISIRCGSNGNAEGNGNGTNNKGMGVTRRIRFSLQSMRSGTGEKQDPSGTDDDPGSSLKLRKRIVDIHGLSRYLEVCINTIYSWVSQGKIPSIKMGRLLRFDLDKIDTWIAERERSAHFGAV